jgi:hypothetical protein
MEIKQKTYLVVEKGGKKAELVVDQDMPLGLLFDCLMEMKGFAVERMAKSHKDEEQEAEQKMGDEVCEAECEKKEEEPVEAA